MLFLEKLSFSIMYLADGGDNNFHNSPHYYKKKIKFNVFINSYK